MKDRFWQIDSARGIAIMGMIIYHFLVDLELLFNIPIGVFEMPVVLLARNVAALFILLVGVSATIKFEQIRSGGLKSVLSTFAKKAGIILFWAGVITVVTYVIFPADYIFFGILHFIGLSMILLIPFLYWKNNISLFIVGLLLIYLGFAFDNLFLKNISSLDYFPLLPWFGVVILGIVTGRIVKFSRNYKTNFLANIGQKSLLIYLLHQPILWGGLWMIKMTGLF